MRVHEMVTMLLKRNQMADLTFSVADDASEDDTERWFAEDGVHDCFGNGHPELGPENETVVTVCIVVKTNR